MMDRGNGPNGEEVVMNTSQVVVGTSQKVEKQYRASRSDRVRRRRKRDRPQLCAVETIGKRVRVLTRQPLKEKESREIDRSLLKCFLLLQTVYPAVCNMGVEKSVADRANALSKAEQKWGRKRKHRQKKTKSINPE